MNFLKKHKIILCILMAILIFSVWSWFPVTERFNIELSDEGSMGIRIALITDLHSCYYGNGQKSLINRIDKESPDIIILGGDIFDDKLSDDNAKILLEDLVTKYPCYYVTGNHEFWSVGGHMIDICGVDDPTDISYYDWIDMLENAYNETDPSHIRILVSHRPEKTHHYVSYDYDLILSGHAHAGQFRIPLINRGLYVPDQGFMAEYVNGIYELSNGSKMIVSRGLARESTPLPRFFNRPELVIINI